MKQSPQIAKGLSEGIAGSREVLNELVALAYDELLRHAAALLSRERTYAALPATALIHEAYMRMLCQCTVRWEGRSHFVAIASSMMRRVLIDRARWEHRKKRGGDLAMLSFSDEILLDPHENSADNLALHEALERLEAVDERKARIVILRFFGGLTLEETAQALSVSRTTVAIDWGVAKTWLRRELTQ